MTGESLGDNPYDTGCWNGEFSDAIIAERLKAEVCDGAADVACLERGSNWKFVFFFNGCTFAALSVSFFLIAVGACSGCVRAIGGILFCVSGLAFLYAGYLTFVHRFVDGHYSELCSLNMSSSYHPSGLMESFDNTPKVFAEDS